MRPRSGPRSVEAARLRQLRVQGVDSPVLDARVAYSEAEGLARYARGLVGKERVYPHLLPTAQASGRWSVTDPPLNNFPAREGYSVAWGLILPYPGEWWAHYDLSALHARIAAAYTNDREDLECFKNSYDIHTRTACLMYGFTFRPPDGVEGCSDWKGKEDRRRRLAKVFRYALLLGMDERAALESKDVEREGLTREEVLATARLYLRSKSTFVTARRRIWEECVRAGKARSFMGRLRRLVGNPLNAGDRRTMMKEGWSHIVQGGEQDIQQTIVGDLFARFPDATLVLNSYDGLTWALPWKGREAMVHHLREARGLVERTWKIQGQNVPIPADWEVIFEGGDTEKGAQLFLG